MLFLITNIFILLLGERKACQYNESGLQIHEAKYTHHTTMVGTQVTENCARYGDKL